MRFRSFVAAVVLAVCAARGWAALPLSIGTDNGSFAEFAPTWNGQPIRAVLGVSSPSVLPKEFNYSWLKVMELSFSLTAQEATGKVELVFDTASSDTWGILVAQVDVWRNGAWQLAGEADIGSRPSVFVLPPQVLSVGTNTVRVTGLRGSTAWLYWDQISVRPATGRLPRVIGADNGSASEFGLQVQPSNRWIAAGVDAAVQANREFNNSWWTNLHVGAVLSAADATQAVELVLDAASLQNPSGSLGVKVEGWNGTGWTSLGKVYVGAYPASLVIPGGQLSEGQNWLRLSGQDGSSPWLYWDRITLQTAMVTTSRLPYHIGTNNGSHAEFDSSWVASQSVFTVGQSVGNFPREFNSTWWKEMTIRFGLGALDATGGVEVVLDPSSSDNGGYVDVELDVLVQGVWLTMGRMRAGQGQVSSCVVPPQYAVSGLNQIRLRGVGGVARWLYWDRITLQRPGVATRLPYVLGQDNGTDTDFAASWVSTQHVFDARAELSGAFPFQLNNTWWSYMDIAFDLTAADATSDVDVVFDSTKVSAPPFGVQIALQDGLAWQDVGLALLGNGEVVYRVPARYLKPGLNRMRWTGASPSLPGNYTLWDRLVLRKALPDTGRIILLNDYDESWITDNDAFGSVGIYPNDTNALRVTQQEVITKGDRCVSAIRRLQYNFALTASETLSYYERFHGSPEAIPTDLSTVDELRFSVRKAPSMPGASQFRLELSDSVPNFNRVTVDGVTTNWREVRLDADVIFAGLNPSQMRQLAFHFERSFVDVQAGAIEIDNLYFVDRDGRPRDLFATTQTNSIHLNWSRRSATAPWSPAGTLTVAPGRQGIDIPPLLLTEGPNRIGLRLLTPDVVTLEERNAVIWDQVQLVSTSGAPLYSIGSDNGSSLEFEQLQFTDTFDADAQPASQFPKTIEYGEWPFHNMQNIDFTLTGAQARQGVRLILDVLSSTNNLGRANQVKVEVAPTFDREGSLPTGFNVYRSLDGAGYVKINSAPITFLSEYVDTAVSAGQTNHYAVSALYGARESDRTPPLTVVTASRDFLPIPAAAWRVQLGNITQPQFLYNSRRGVALGGFGAGSFMYNACGGFGPFFNDMRTLQEAYLSGAAFHAYEKVGTNAPLVRSLTCNHPTKPAWTTLGRDDAVYYALQPRGWVTYNNFQTDISMELFSPILTNNYRETSYPVALFRYKISNRKPQAATVGIMLTWPQAAPYGSLPRVGYTNGYRGTGLSQGMVMKATSPDNPVETRNSEWYIGSRAATPGAFTMAQSWNEYGDGSDVWNDFKVDGKLTGAGYDTSYSGGAIAQTVTLQPNTSTELVFAVTWDFPVVVVGADTEWWRKYTMYFGRDGDNAHEMAAQSFSGIASWASQIDAWQRPYLQNTNMPAWLVRAAFNELYYSQMGGVFWEAGIKSRTNEFMSLHEGDNKFMTWECVSCPFAETLDVRHYYSTLYARWWPQIERDVLRTYADGILYYKADGSTPHDLGSPADQRENPSGSRWGRFDQWRIRKNDALKTAIYTIGAQNESDGEFNPGWNGSDFNANTETASTFPRELNLSNQVSKTILFTLAASDAAAGVDVLVDTAATVSNKVLNISVDLWKSNAWVNVGLVRGSNNAAHALLITNHLVAGQNRMRWTAILGGEDPLFKYDFYAAAVPDAEHWIDSPAKFIQECYQYYRFTNDLDFLTYAWPAMKATYGFMKAKDQDGDFIPDHKIDGADNTFDGWGFDGSSIYVGFHWVAALEMLQRMGQVLGDTGVVAEAQVWETGARATIEQSLWNPSLGYYNLYRHGATLKTDIMADAMGGQLIADVLGLGDLLDTGRMASHLDAVFDRCVVPMRDFTGDGIGDVGAVNGRTAAGGPVSLSDPHQANQVWVGINYALAALMYQRGMRGEAMFTAFGSYYPVFEDEGLGYWFQTPEAWDEDGRYPIPGWLSAQYMRARAAWQLLFAIERAGP
jgi:uncharacterized protein (DUF608 family)